MHSGEAKMLYETRKMSLESVFNVGNKNTKSYFWATAAVRQSSISQLKIHSLASVCTRHKKTYCIKTNTIHTDDINMMSVDASVTAI